MSKSDYLKFLNQVIRFRLNRELKKENAEMPPFVFNGEDSELCRFFRENSLSDPEIITVLLALAPHLLPDFFNSVVFSFFPNGGDFPEFGGAKGKNHRGILPTGETVLYVLAGNDPDLRSEFVHFFSEDHLFAKKNLLYLEDVPPGEPQMSGRLVMEQDFIELFTTGKTSRPRLSSDFPAQFIETGLEWKDLILNEKTFKQITEIETWLKHNETLMNDWNMRNRIKPGFRVLFSGPPGTGKTLTATLLGKYTGRDVFRIDLSLVVSKYIGETEKNLSRLFDRAKNKNWILFFDEADAIFGKRTSVRDAHDKYANQEVSYLLQRIESHPGLVILASNMKGNIDSAFTRRFNAIVEFEIPSAEERLTLWQNNIPMHVRLDDQVKLEEIARKYEVNGANIVNIVHFACLKTLEKNSKTISLSDLLNGIQKEYVKEGKMINLR
jgi:AAA+ superfamily predicted ATPase